MTITKPFTFAAGTKARANEVNTNFDILYAQVNTNISDIASLSNDISAFDLTKADVNGNALNTFAVKDPVNSSDAINKGYLNSIISTGSWNFNGTVKVPASTTAGTALQLTSTGNNSGYTKFWIHLGDNTLIQWGYGAIPANQTTVAISTPRSFKDFGTNDFRQSIFITDYGSGIAISQFKIYDRQAGSFSVRTSNTSGGNPFFWLAIGKGV